jgi:hypothetical protein
MDKIVEAILDSQIINDFFHRLGFNNRLTACLSVVLVTLLMAWMTALCNFLRKRYKAKKDALQDIKPQFDHFSIKKAKRFYIQTQYQNASPAREEEPGFTHRFIARNKLIPFFIKTAFNEKVESERFYLILADSGMGKTTFMINLYLRYYSWLSFSRRPDDMKLFRFSDPDTIAQVKAFSTEQAKKTILLLDALDEDPGILSTDPDISDAQAFQKRVDEIIEMTRNFKEVVITCRTQYFPWQEEDPYELKIKRPDEKGFYTLNKLYISPFNDEEVKKYLYKKFGSLPMINEEKRETAFEIVSKSRNLVMRPMLLSYIDYLIQGEMMVITSLNIYKILVNKWLSREAEKRKMIAKRDVFIGNLYNLSVKIAVAIYSNWRADKGMYISKEEAVQLAKQFNIELRPEEITGQSLLTCDGVGNWKFAHKSIFEFFLASEACKNPMYLKQMSFKGMDMARKFYEESEPRLMLMDMLIVENNKGDISEDLPTSFIYSTVVTDKEFDELGGIHRNSRDFKRFYLDEVILFCNKINIDNGYPSMSEWDINNTEPFRGFRLPTNKELEIYFNKQNLSVSITAIKELQKIMLMDKEIEPVTIDENALIDILSQSIDEWCYVDNRITQLTQDAFVKSLPGGSSALMGSAGFNAIQHFHKQGTFPFRLVFVP